MLCDRNPTCRVTYNLLSFPPNIYLVVFLVGNPHHLGFQRACLRSRLISDRIVSK